MKTVFPWFFLKSVPGIGNHLFKKLIDHFHTPENILNASDNDFSAIDGITGKVISAIANHKMPDKIYKDIELTYEKGFDIVTMADPDYPVLLKEIPDPPPFLYVYGKIESSPENIAIVGSRNATSYGISVAKKLGNDISSFGINIISGMARGIDTSAHHGALKSGNKTVAVLGCGLGNIYPPENKTLFHKIAENGAVISEFPVKEGPAPYNFPLRNRIICGMSLGTVVVEASKKSGSLITARLAAEQGREVFAVPGSIHSFRSVGTHSLIKQGAKLIENAQDIFEEIPFILNMNENKKNEQGVTDSNTGNPKKNAGSLDENELRVIGALEPYPVHIDELSRRLSYPPGNLLSILLKLEIAGVVSQTPGKFFNIKEENCGKTINYS